MKKWLSCAFRVVSSFLIVIFVVIIVFVLYGYFQINVRHKEYVNYFGYTFFEVASGSMSPSININDLIIVKLNCDSYGVSDVITYVSGDDFITHRIYSIKDGVIVTKGDNNDSVDSSIYKSDILGRVVYVIPEFGIWKMVIFDKRVLISLSITFVLFGIYFSIGNVKRDKGDSIEDI